MAGHDDDDLIDFYEDDESPIEDTLEPWNILIVDDEEDIHTTTKLALSKFEFEGKKLSFFHAYSAKQAKEILLNNGDFALVFIDVVMESDHAGLDLIKTIRTELKNHKSRLIIRTGQPGFAPEDEVIQQYDINDYRNKSELTSSKLKNSCYTALRSYRDLCNLERSQYGLEEIVLATSKFQQSNNQTEFISHLLAHIVAVAQLEGELCCCVAVTEKNAAEHLLDYRVLAATGINNPDDLNFQKLPKEVQIAFELAIATKKSVRSDDCFVGYFCTDAGTINLMYVSSPGKITAVEHNILEYFSNSVAVSYENMTLRSTVQESQKEIVCLLGEAVEKRSKETGSHVRRVANYCYLLAKEYGLSEIEASQLKAAAPLHDVGKIAIPDNILHKPGKLTAQEWQIMQTHATEGEEILSHSSNAILQIGAIVAGQHHEKWDGSGYPKGLKGEEIHIVGRITALADVFDALSNARCYKAAWPEEEILEFVQQNKGAHFDPELVDILLANLDAVRKIKVSFPD